MKYRISEKGVFIILSVLVTILICSLIVGVTFFTRTDTAYAEASTASENDTLEHDDGEEITEFDYSTVWSQLIDESMAAHEQRELVLYQGDWNAKSNGSGTSFGAGTGFSNGRLYVPANADIKIDLNGKTINRKLFDSAAQINNPQSDGQVIYVRGTLEICDTSASLSGIIGRITGGNNDSLNEISSGGGILVENGGKLILTRGSITDNRAVAADGGGVSVGNGTFIMNGGEIIDNRSGLSGGGVCISNNGSFSMTGGAISGNTATIFGGGVHLYVGSFSVENNVVVAENYLSNGADSNVYIAENMQLGISGPLSPDSRIGIAAAKNEYTFTTGFSRYGAGVDYTAIFESNSGNNIYRDAVGELQLSGKQVLLRPSLSRATYTYDGTRHVVSYAKGPNTITTVDSDTNAEIVNLNPAIFTESGERFGIGAKKYQLTVSIVDKVTYMWGDGTDSDYVLEWEIEKANYSMSNLRWNYSAETPFTYDGEFKTVELNLEETQLPAGVTFNRYLVNSQKDAGKYIAKAIFDYRDTANYNEPTVPDCEWEIQKAKPDRVSVFGVEGKHLNGSTISSFTISGNSGTVEGTFSWSTPNERISDDFTREYVWVFTPTDSNYATVTGAIKLTEDNIFATWLVVTIAGAIFVVVLLVVIIIIIAVKRSRASRAKPERYYADSDSSGFGDISDDEYAFGDGEEEEVFYNE